MNNKGQYSQQSTYPPTAGAAATGAVYPPTMSLPQAPPYADAPPAYSELYRTRYMAPPTAAVPQLPATYPGASMYLPVGPSVAGHPVTQTMPMAYYPVGPLYPPGSTVIIDGAYDAGARFGAGASASLPPPPPGCPPNAAQLAAMQGANVVMTQRKGNYYLGGSDGGYTIW
ncbi:DAZ-associated protein 2 isoform X2 [Protopterus annectens]|uniref:DAZ-associated protein 2 isoform X2 n=1 Tax=Protopterus annectens TaxID=7888 RepID=UPI001CFC2260|nr:DAZ-associated protein 2 isoform X2 [Protopterus annectens]